MLCQGARSIPTVVGEIYEQGLYDIAQNIKENYGNIEWIPTENGMGVEGEEKFRKDGVIKTTTGLTFIKDHLRELHRAIQDGANCKRLLDLDLYWLLVMAQWLQEPLWLSWVDLESQKRTLKNPVIGLKN